MRKLQLAKIIVVATALLTPAMSLLVMGLGDGFENRDRTELPALGDMLAPDPDARARFAKALFEGAKVKQEAINVVSKAQLELTEQIETPAVISGNDGWLFFKPGLAQWHCSAHKDLQPRLDRMEFMFDLVASSGVELVFAIAPNKASIERDKFGGRAEVYKQCYGQIQAAFEALTGAASARVVVDHSLPMRALVDAGNSAYLKWDTHWTQVAGLDAMNQLFAARPGEIGLPHESPEMAPGAQYADLAAMLALDASGLPDIMTPQPAPIDAALMPPVQPLILHDSFYERIMPYLTARAPSAAYARLQEHRLEVAEEALAQASLVVFSAVQRDYLRYVWSPDALGWGGTVGNWILDRATAAAQQCNWDEGMKVKTRRDGRDRGARIFTIPPPFRTGAFCLRIATILSQPAAATLQVSSSEWGMPEFGAGRLLEQQLRQGTDTLGVILPRSYASEQYRLAFRQRGAGATNVVVEVARPD